MTVRDLPTPPVGNPTVWKNRIVESGFENPEQLLANPLNWRVHPKNQQDALEAVLDEVGYVDRVLVNRTTGFVVDGHLRVAVGISRKETAIPVDYLDLTEQEEALILATFDAITGMATTDKDKLKALLDIAKPQSDAARDVLEKVAAKGGVRRDTSGVPEAQVDKADELEKKWETARGQLWGLGNHRLLIDDCTIEENIARLMQKQKMRLFLSDPPYGVSYADKNAYLNTVVKGNRVQTPIENDHLNPVETADLWLKSFSTAFAVADEGCPYYIASPQGGELMLQLMTMILKAGWELKHTIIWVKNNHVLGRSDYQYKHEPLLYGWKPGSHWFYGDRSQFSVWEVDKPLQSDLHPTMKPVELFARAIANSSKVGEIVCDWFTGSGTTLVACEHLGRVYYGCELSPAYGAVILQRWHEMTGLTPQLVSK